VFEGRGVGGGAGADVRKGKVPGCGLKKEKEKKGPVSLKKNVGGVNGGKKCGQDCEIGSRVTCPKRNCYEERLGRVANRPPRGSNHEGKAKAIHQWESFENEKDVGVTKSVNRKEVEVFGSSNKENRGHQKWEGMWLGGTTMGTKMETVFEGALRQP